MNELYSFFGCCKIVNGNTYSIIIDLQRNRFCRLNKSIANILVDIQAVPIDTLLKKIDNKFRAKILELVLSLEKQEYLFKHSSDLVFPELTTFDASYSIASNAIVEISNDNFANLKLILKELYLSGVSDLEIRAVEKFNQNSIDDIIKITSNYNFTYSIIAPFNQKIDLKSIQRTIRSSGLYASVIFHSSPLQKRMEDYWFQILLLKKNLSGNFHCGKISSIDYGFDIISYSEALKHNSCLNRKISVDTEGNIKNCPSMKESYGNIIDTTLAEAIENPGFKKYWDINKDKIHVCKDCEFRYICTDCRAYVEDPEDILSKPLKCGYNPYTGDWSEWSTNPLKQKAIDFYDMREMVDEMNENSNTN